MPTSVKQASGYRAVILQKHLSGRFQFLDFLAPFSNEVWFWVIGFHLIFGLALKIISSLKKTQHYGLDDEEIDA